MINHNVVLFLQESLLFCSETHQPDWKWPDCFSAITAATVGGEDEVFTSWIEQHRYVERREKELRLLLLSRLEKT